MRLHFLQHVPFEGLGCIETWAENSGIHVSCTRLFLDEPLPSQNEFDLLVVMGGPMNIFEDALYPWLTREKIFIEKAVRAGRHVMGICLGAQLIANILGADVYPNKYKEIGWFPIRRSGETGHVFQNIFPEQIKVLHWHGDTFDLPDQSIPLASSEACRNQGFIYKEKVIALQFHLESTRESLQDLIAHCGDEIVDAPFVQSPVKMLSDGSLFQNINKVMDDLLDSWSKKAQSPSQDFR